MFMGRSAGSVVLRFRYHKHEVPVVITIDPLRRSRSPHPVGQVAQRDAPVRAHGYRASSVTPPHGDRPHPKGRVLFSAGRRSMEMGVRSLKRGGTTAQRNGSTIGTAGVSREYELMADNDLFERACEEFHRENFEHAIVLFRQAAESGDVPAMERLACLYADGTGTALDIDRSMYWDKAAVDAVSTVSAGNLAITYRTLGDIRESKRWLEKAIELGDHDAALELAKQYMVSDKEHKTVRMLLKIVLASDSVSDASR